MLCSSLGGGKDAASEKYQRLCNYIALQGSVAVCYSGGADSSLLLKAAIDALHERAAAVVVVTDFTIKRELFRAKEFCATIRAKLNIINMPLLSNPLFKTNPANRCFLCKKAMFTAVKRFAKERGILHIIEGTNKSDCIADRPGFAAVKEEGIISPLRECGLVKADVREISRRLSLITWNAPSNSCLATRFAYGEVLTKERLEAVEKAEDFLVSCGMKDVRVKVGGRDE